MPPLPAVAGVIRCDIDQTIGEDHGALNRIFLGYTGGVASEAFVTLVAQGVSSHWRSNIEPDLGTFHSLNFVRATDLSSDVAATYTDTTTATGADTGDPLGADTAMRFKWLVQRRYRGGHGGWYLGGLVEDRLQDAQTWSAATLTAFATDYNNFIAGVVGIATGGFVVNAQVVVSYYHGFTLVVSPTTGRGRNVPTLRPTPPGPRVDALTGAEIDTHVSSQRRRTLIRS